MADSIVGIATIRHAKGVITAAAALSVESLGFNYKKDAERSELTVGSDVISSAAGQKRETLSVDLVITGADAEDYETPDVNTEVTLTTFKPTVVNGDYNVVSGDIIGKQGDNVMAKLELKRYGGTSLSP